MNAATHTPTTIPIGYVLAALALAVVVYSLLKWARFPGRGENEADAAVRRQQEAAEARRRAERSRRTHNT